MFDRQSPFLPKISTDMSVLASKRIRHDIITGALAPGERLSEQSLCVSYKFGRGVIRAALSRLAHQGFVFSRARSGWEVMSITALGFREITLARRQLEPLLADVDLAPGDFDRIEAICDMQAALLSDPRLSADHLLLLRAYERDIRDLLAAHIKAPLLAGWLANLWDKSALYLNFVEASSPGRLPLSDWGPYVAARKAGRTREAATIIRKAGEAFSAFVQSRLLESGLVVPPSAAKPVRTRAARKSVPAERPAHPPSSSGRTPG